MSGAGAATFNNDVTAFSDKRLKTDIEPIDKWFRQKLCRCKVFITKEMM